jgi:hypothetical protein
MGASHQHMTYEIQVSRNKHAGGGRWRAEKQGTIPPAAWERRHRQDVTDKTSRTRQARVHPEHGMHAASR